MTFPHLNGRGGKLAEELNLPPETAEWLAVVALHSGCYLRSQLRCYSNQDHKAMTRFSRRLIEQNLILEMPVEAMGLLSRITNKTIYRALGAADIRHRRLASWPVTYRRLLSLDYVLDHPDLPWLPTEAEKMACFDGLEIPRKELPSRLYQGAVGQARRYFANKHPIAVNSHAKTALFVYVDSDEQSPQGLRSWRAEHAALWSRLCGRGFRLSIVHASRNPRLSNSVRSVFEGWSNTPGGSASGGEIEAERRRVREALEKLDKAVLDTYGGFNGALRRSVELKKRLERGEDIDGYEATYSVSLSQRIQPRSAWRNALGKRWSEAEAQGDEP